MHTYIAVASASEEAEATSLSSACVHGRYNMDDECSVGEEVGYEGGQK